MVANVLETRLQLNLMLQSIVGRMSDNYLQETKDLARKAAHIFGTKHRSQMRNLERVALGALAYADIMDFIHMQAGKTTEAGKLWRKEQFAEDLLIFAPGDQYMYNISHLS